MKNKRGLSDVISTVLIVLLALAAIAIVWGFIQPALKSGGTALDYRQKCLDAEVKPTFCNSSSNTTTVQYLKGDVNQIVSSVVHSSGAVDNLNKSAGNILSTVQFSFTGTGSGIRTGDKARAAAVVLDSEGTLRPCDFSPIEVTCVA